jgi:hypothetical protein
MQSEIKAPLDKLLRKILEHNHFSAIEISYSGSGVERVEVTKDHALSWDRYELFYKGKNILGLAVDHQNPAITQLFLNRKSDPELKPGYELVEEIISRTRQEQS